MCHFHTTFYLCRHDASSSFIECNLYSEYQRHLATGVLSDHPKLILYLEICKREEDTTGTHPLCPSCITTTNEHIATAVMDEIHAIEEIVAAAGEAAIRSLSERAAARRAQEQAQAISRARNEMMMTMSMEQAMQRRDWEGEEGDETEQETEEEQEETVSDEERRTRRWEEVMMRRAEDLLLEMRGGADRRRGRAGGASG